MTERLTLVSLDLKNFQGLYTKSSPDVLNPEQLDIAENVDFFQVYGGAAKIKGNVRILSTTYKESSVVKPISWVGFYKEADLDGTILRKTLIAAGTTIQDVNISTGALTSLKTGRTSGLYHTSDNINKFMLITNQDPDRVGAGDDMIKYDGTSITRWGVIPPGSQEDGSTVATGKIVETFTAISQFGATADTVITASTTTTWDGHSIKVAKTGTAGNECGFYGIPTTTGAPSTVTTNRVAMYVYIPRGQMANLRQSAVDADQAMRVRFSSDTGAPPYQPTTNCYDFYIKVGQLVEGWNKLSFSFNAAPTGSTGIQLGTFTGTVNSFSVSFFTTNNSDLLSGMFVSHLVFYDPGTPSGTQSATGGTMAAGVFTYKVTFVNKYGTESNAGPATAAITTTGSDTSKVDFTSIPISNDSTVVARKLYRTVAGGTLYLSLATINDNITTTYTDTTADGSLSTITAPQAGDFSNDNSPPPRAGIVKVWKKTVFLAGDPQNPNSLYFSNDDGPETFPLINTFEFDSKITGIYETYSGIVVETDVSKWQILGDNPDFAVDKIIDGMGNVGRRAVGTARMVGWSVDRDGMRLYDLSDTKKISEPIRDKYDQDINKVNIEFIHTVHQSRRNAILQFNPNASGVYDSIYMYQYSIDDVRTGWWSTVVIPSAVGLDFQHAVEIEDSNGSKMLLAGTKDGMLHELFSDSSNNWVSSEGVTYPITMKMVTPYIRMMTMDGAQSVTGLAGRVHPRFIELRIDSHGGDPTTYNITIDMADGVAQRVASDSQTVNMQFGINNSVLRYPTRELTAAEYIKLTIINADLNVDTTVLAIKVMCHVRPGQYAISDVDNTV